MTSYTNNATGAFTSRSGKNACTSRIRKHVLESYLAAKVANLLGIRLEKVTDDVVIRIPAKYANSEGVIKSQEEITGLRVDLQAAQRHGEHLYAAWQVQWGTGSGSNGSAYAGVLMRVDTDFTFAEFRQAMGESFGYDPGAYCRLDP